MINFNPPLLAPYFRFSEGPVAVAMGQSTPVCNQNPQRVLLVIANNLGSTVQVRPVNPAGTSAGINILASNQLIITLADWGSLVWQSWNMFSTGIGGTVYVMEVSYAPPGGE